ncbi:MAG: preprotein translocase subunit SecE [Halioglobus sp.]|jgi:preprotein translocase subunit SecE
MFITFSVRTIIIKKVIWPNKKQNQILTIDIYWQ